MLISKWILHIFLQSPLVVHLPFPFVPISFFFNHTPPSLSASPLLPKSRKTLIPFPSRPREPQTVGELLQRAPAPLPTTARVQRHHSIVHNHAHKLATFALALQLLKIRPGSKRDCPCGRIATGVLRLFQRRVG